MYLLRRSIKVAGVDLRHLQSVVPQAETEVVARHEAVCGGLLRLIRLVRDYLDLEFQGIALPFAFDLERMVDDFVLFCMLIGNDFLPGARIISGLTPLASQKVFHQ